MRPVFKNAFLAFSVLATISMISAQGFADGPGGRGGGPGGGGPGGGGFGGGRPGGGSEGRPSGGGFGGGGGENRPAPSNNGGGFGGGSRPGGEGRPSGSGFGGGGMDRPSRPTPSFPTRPSTPSNNGGGFGGGSRPGGEGRPSGGGFGGGGMNRPSRPTPTMPTSPSSGGVFGGGNSRPTNGGVAGGATNSGRPMPAKPQGPAKPGFPNTAGRNDREGRGQDPTNIGRRSQITERRGRVDTDRRNNQSQILDLQNRLHTQRDQFDARRNVSYQVNVSDIRNNSRWTSDYNTWWSDCRQPKYVSYRVTWFEPMPSFRVWSYEQVDTVAVNLENLSREIYDLVADSGADQAVLSALAQLADATEEYTDAVYAGDDYTDNLDDLFYLNSSLQTAMNALRASGRESLVASDMKAMRLYVNQLLWTYHQNY